MERVAPDSTLSMARMFDCRSALHWFHFLLLWGIQLFEFGAIEMGISNFCDMRETGMNHEGKAILP